MGSSGPHGAMVSDKRVLPDRLATFMVPPGRTDSEDRHASSLLIPLL